MIAKSSAALIALYGASKAFAQDGGFTPIASRQFTYSALPYQADPDDGERGRQHGYNICNSTTEGPNSLCQTAVINSIDDFCLWGPPEPDSLIGDTEGEAVAWCTKPGRGTRLIPEGAITGLQFVRTPDYIQVTGTIDQRLINIETNDFGGEMDPHGADQRGNPLGGLLFSNTFSGDYVYLNQWHNFMGNNEFCLKACDPAGPNAARFCEHIFDRIGCFYNAPAPYTNGVGVFESCQGDNQDFPGIYTGADGVESTYTQPPESLGAISEMPYQPRTPASSECQTFESASLFNGLPQATGGPRPTSGADEEEEETTRTGSGSTSRTRTRTSTTGSNTAENAEETEGDSSALKASVAVGGLSAVFAALVALL